MKINPLDQCNGKKIRANEKINQKNFKDFQILLQMEIRGKVLSRHWDFPVCLRDLSTLQFPGPVLNVGRESITQHQLHLPVAGQPELLSYSENKGTAVKEQDKPWQPRAFLKNLCTCAKGTSLLVSSQTGAQSKQEEGQKAEALAESPSMIL